MGQKWWKGGVFVRSTVRNKYLKILLTTKHCAATPRKPQRKGSTAGSCVSASVVKNILYIHNIQLAFFQ